MPYTFSTSGAAIALAGKNAASRALTGDQYDDISDKIENTICAIAGFDCIGNFDSLTANGRQILGFTEDAMFASHIVAVDEGAIGLGESAAKKNYLENLKDFLITFIRDNRVKKYLKIEAKGS